MNTATNNGTQNTAPNSNFIKAMIKIANPGWSPEQIEAEAQRKLNEAMNPTDDDKCEFCSS